MNIKDQALQFKNLLKDATKIVVLQADNPDGDSLSSSLALEQILGEQCKDVFMYCSVDMPNHLKHLSGWDRVQTHFPSQYDLCIMVDNASLSLLENFKRQENVDLSSKPLVIIDHHATESTVDFAELSVIDTASVSAGQVVFRLVKEMGLQLDQTSASFIASSILSDTLGLTTDAVTNNPRVFKDMAELIEAGVSMAELQAKRLEALKYDRSLVPYKGQLMQRVEFSDDGHIASIAIPHEEIKEHSMKFNPTIILDELRMVEGVLVTLGFKQYQREGKLFRVTVRIRCDRTVAIAQDLAESFGGGGHKFASGIKFEGQDLNFDEIKANVSSKTHELLANI